MTVKWRHCAIADRDHRENIRNYAHTYHYPRTICLAEAFWELPREYRDGIILHEIGHLLAGPQGSEADANRAAEEWSGSRIQYVDSPYGRRLERVKNMAGVRILRRRSVLLNPDDQEDIDWQQRYGQEEQPEIAEYLGYEGEPDIEVEE